MKKRECRLVIRIIRYIKLHVTRKTSQLNSNEKHLAALLLRSST
jgi:hypothetical protein